jgi:hypothetical protein
MDYNKPDVLDKADSMLLKCGSFASIIQIVCSVLSILCLCGFGIILFRTKDTKIKTTATVLHGQCNTYPVRTNSSNYTRMETDCILDIEYKVGDEMKQTKVNTSDKMHSKGEIIEIYYEPSNPESVKYKPLNNKIAGKILMGIGSCIIILMVIHIILMKKSDWYKRLLCFNLIGSAFSGSRPGMNFGNSGFGFGGINPGFQTNFG